MPDEQQSTLSERELATKIVTAYLQHNRLGADQLGTLISIVHQAFGRLGEPTEAVVERTPAVPVKRSVHRDYVVCLECGHRSRILKRHLTTHNLSVEEYRSRWNLPREHPVVAPAYREGRSRFAKQIGLGRRRAVSSPGVTDVV